ncbi:MAG TPA: YdeI/OmpD-associated family protein [Thermoleophilaceae bacterium]|nr:YdeI/OmpD-associated family protein [Thermoleophilaceae bacterium]
MPSDDLPVLPFRTQADWEAWLEGNHADSQGVWLKIAKKASGIETVTHLEALDVALCFGWIDGQRKGLDETWFLQRFTPRRARSRWSQVNRDNVERLTAEGRMRPAGMREVERAKQDGRWEAAYPSVRTIEVPPDLRQALDAEPAAAKLFAELDSRNRYAILYRLHDAKRPETRARRIERFVAMLARGEKPYP